MAGPDDTTRGPEAPSELLSPEPEPRLGRVGRYVVLDVLGRGGMGTVLRAFDPVLERPVALKLLRADRGALARPEARERLLREAQAMARVVHPNIVRVHDAGAVGAEIHIAMDLVEGTTLREWLDEGHGRSQVLDLLLAAGEGLAAAHDAGLVHRDFKPANVLVDRSGHPWVTDFGLARLVAPSGAAPEPAEPSSGLAPTTVAFASDLTAAGMVVGTPAYMAPEQHRGEAIDARSDQFSFCVTAWEAMFGVRPFPGRDAGELLRAALGRAPSPGRGPRWLRPILGRGLAPEPWQRHPSMKALLSEIARGQRRARRIAVGAAATVLVLSTVGGPAAWRAAAAAAACRTDDPELRAVAAAMDGRRGEGTSAFGRFADRLVAARRGVCTQQRIDGVRSDQSAAGALECLDQRRREAFALAGHGGRAAAGSLDDPARCLDRTSADEPAVSEPVRDTLAAIFAARAVGDAAEAGRLARGLLESARRDEDRRLEARAALLAARAALDAGDRAATDGYARAAADVAEALALDELAAEAWTVRARAAATTGDRMLAFAAAAHDRAATRGSTRAEFELARARSELAQGRADRAGAAAIAAWTVLEREPAPWVRLEILELLAELADPDHAAGRWLEVVARAESLAGPTAPRTARARARLSDSLRRGADGQGS
jgi:hypothetical protein